MCVCNLSAFFAYVIYERSLNVNSLMTTEGTIFALDKEEEQSLKKKSVTKTVALDVKIRKCSLITAL